MPVRYCTFLCALFCLPVLTGCPKPAENDVSNAPAADGAPADGEPADNDATDHSEQDEKPHWGYTGEIGPAHWADLSEEWKLARDGKEQSPIDITDAQQGELPQIEYQYGPTRINVVNNGHTIQVNYDEGSSITLDGKTYRLLQFHFHAPSEHTINGESFDMEVHLVHKSDEGELAVIGVMFKPGEINGYLQPLWKHFPTESGEEKHSEDMFGAGSLLPEGASYYTYQGSLTTPPCSENVRWLVLTEPLEVSAEQIEAFTSIYSGNNRPVQPLNDRVITRSE